VGRRADEGESGARARQDRPVVARGALEDHSDETSWWFDPATGEVEPWSEYLSSGEEGTHPEDRGLIAIEPIPSHEAYGDMEDFIASVRDPRAPDLLQRAIQERGAFRRSRTRCSRSPSCGPPGSPSTTLAPSAGPSGGSWTRASSIRRWRRRSSGRVRTRPPPRRPRPSIRTASRGRSPRTSRVCTGAAAAGHRVRLVGTGRRPSGVRHRPAGRARPGRLPGLPGQGGVPAWLVDRAT